MKNIHVLPTDKPSRIYSYKGNSFLTTESHLHSPSMEYQNIYITSDEEIKEGDWCIYLGLSMTSFKVIEIESDKLFYGSRESFNKSLCKKIILTTDADLIKDGIQSIDDDFLEWFVKNPSCEEVEVERGLFNSNGKKVDIINAWRHYSNCVWYKIIIPKEEPKQETLEEVNFKVLGTKTDTFYNGAKWQQEQDKNKYSEEEVLKFLINCPTNTEKETIEWFEKFKKK